MTFFEAIKTVMVDKYATFSGRATRSEYWYSVLFYYLLFLPVIFLGKIIDSPEFIIVLFSVLSLILLVPSLAVCIRRLHDTGKSGWWLLLALIPYIGSLIVIVFYCMPSDGDNKYGVKPE